MWSAIMAGITLRINCMCLHLPRIQSMRRANCSKRARKYAKFTLSSLWDRSLRTGRNNVGHTCRIWAVSHRRYRRRLNQTRLWLTMRMYRRRLAILRAKVTGFMCRRIVRHLSWVPMIEVQILRHISNFSPMKSILQTIHSKTTSKCSQSKIWRIKMKL